MDNRPPPGRPRVNIIINSFTVITLQAKYFFLWAEYIYSINYRCVYINISVNGKLKFGVGILPHGSSEGHEMLKRNDKYHSIADDVPIPKM